MITEDEFEESLKILSYCQETYDTKKRQPMLRELYSLEKNS